jgi:hypothetical protein
MAAARGEIALGSDESGDCSITLLLGRDAALRVREGFGMCELRDWGQQKQREGCFKRFRRDGSLSFKNKISSFPKHGITTRY